MFKYAFLSIFRNKIRTLTTVAIIFMMAFGIIFIMSMSQGMFNNILKSNQQSFIGTVMIHGKGYKDLFNDTSDFNVSVPSATLEAVGELYSANSELKSNNSFGYTLRSYNGGLLASFDVSSPAGIIGVDAANELGTYTWTEKIAEGSYFTQESGEIILGKVLAKTLQVKPGDAIVALVATEDGGFFDAYLTVVGILESLGGDFDRGTSIISSESYFNLFQTDKINEINFFMKDGSEEAFIQELSSQLDLNNSDIEIFSWITGTKSVANVVETAQTVLKLYFLIVIFIAFIAIFNTMILTVNERLYEYSTLRAVGTPKSRIFTTIVLEGLTINMFGVIAGIAIAACTVYYFNQNGLYMRSLENLDVKIMGSKFDASIKFAPVIWAFLSTFVLMTITSIVASIYPAIKAMNIVITGERR